MESSLYLHCLTRPRYTKKSCNIKEMRLFLKGKVGRKPGKTWSCRWCEFVDGATLPLSNWAIVFFGDKATDWLWTELDRITFLTEVWGFLEFFFRTLRNNYSSKDAQKPMIKAGLTYLSSSGKIVFKCSLWKKAVTFLASDMLLFYQNSCPLEAEAILGRWARWVYDVWLAALVSVSLEGLQKHHSRP